MRVFCAEKGGSRVPILGTRDTSENTLPSNINNLRKQEYRISIKVVS